ncbi:hypothetical protein IGB42_03407 [Andreprevotia sp. IGB-42]|uniref:GNAT family N-acetyltransferase n=1 Tax=Andreprevotia sp. IGB-42 TaxID=2497473 RepID=UPI00135B60E9|nr:N-acetyltransferase [Andreprevotia sp. IGB-42]KAF0812130.1 hypothetical protein IGB42_03407 [Andreprevotia sp. IGB-42]
MSAPTRQPVDLSALQLCPAADGDLDFLRVLFASTRIDELALSGWSDEQKAQFLLQQFEAQHAYYQQHYHDAEFSLIVYQEQPIGRLYVFRGPSTINLIDISLLPDWRQCGIGSHYLRALTAEADQAGKAIRLFVEQTNPARQLYERFGFSVTGSNNLYLQMHRTTTGMPQSQARAMETTA